MTLAYSELEAEKFCSLSERCPIATGLFSDLLPLISVTTPVQLELTDQSYLPKTDAPKADWVARVAIPAFLAFVDKYGEGSANDFATIGTGCGLDALAAVEVLVPKRLVMTDIHRTVTDMALKNVRNNLRHDLDVNLIAVPGDLTDPLDDQNMTFDLIYENLPNIPMPSSLRLDEGQTSSSYHAKRQNCPAIVSDNLLALHYLCLLRGRHLLKPGGRIVCSIGARCALHDIIEMANVAGYHATPLILTWKVQSEPEDVIRGYANQEDIVSTPFRFYPTEVLEEAFSTSDPVSCAKHAYEIEEILAPHSLSAKEALEIYTREPVGHTVVAIEAQPA